jgi:hypothetical protein
MIQKHVQWDLGDLPRSTELQSSRVRSNPIIFTQEGNMEGYIWRFDYWAYARSSFVSWFRVLFLSFRPPSASAVLG